MGTENPTRTENQIFASNLLYGFFSGQLACAIDI